MIALLSYFHMVHCSFIFSHKWLHSNKFCKKCQNWFCASWRCLCCMMAFAGAFTQSNNASALHDKQRQPGQKQFWHVLQKCIAVQPSMADCEWTMYQMKGELRYNALKSVLLYLFFFGGGGERNVETTPWFLFSLLTLYTVAQLSPRRAI